MATTQKQDFLMLPKRKHCTVDMDDDTASARAASNGNAAVKEDC